MSNVHKNGSVLVYGIMIFTMLVLIALSIAATSLIDKNSSMVTSNSMKAYQVADSGAETFLKERDDVKEIGGTIADLYDGTQSSSLLCDASGKLKDTANKKTIAMYKKDGTLLDCNTDASEDVCMTYSIKSWGEDGEATRAINVNSFCVETNSSAYDADLIGKWLLDDASLTDETGINSGAQIMKAGGAPDPTFFSIDGKPAVVLNTGFTTTDNYYNYIKIPGNLPEYMNQAGTYSFWFRSEQGLLSANGTAWVPFSKDGVGCDRRGSIRDKNAPYPGTPTGFVYIDVNMNEIFDAGDINSPQSEVDKCDNDTLFEDVCDCGHLSVYLNNGYIGVPAGHNNRLLLRFQNDGNYGYKLINDDMSINNNLQYVWHMATLTYDSHWYKFYVDGVLQDSFNGLGNDHSMAERDSQLEGEVGNKFDINLGRFNGTGTYNYDRQIYEGALADFRIYSRALDECEVENVYNDTKP